MSNKSSILKSLVLFIALSISSDFRSANSVAFYNETNDPDIKERVMNLPLQMEVRYNEEVKEHVEYFIEKNKKLSATLLGRAAMYFPMIEATLAENNIPTELKYLTVIESGLVPYLSSNAGASGLWQFMKPTAEQFGLKVTNTIDERKDAEKSTQAVAKYLKKLYSIYNDWTLVLAAYNCGDGVVNRALKNDNKSYWDIRNELPKQTQEFVPKFIAAAYLMNYYYLHDITPLNLPDEYLYTASIKVRDKIDLKKLSLDYQIDYEVLKRLNAMYVKDFIPESDGEYVVTLPESHAFDFINNYNYFDQNIVYSPLSKARHDIAAAKSKSDEMLAIANAERNETGRPIDNLPGSVPGIVHNNITEMKLEEEVNIKVVKIRKGKSLNDIAQENGVELASLMELNKIDEKYPPKVGDQIKVRI